MNPFKKQAIKSIFNEELEDQKMQIPGNLEIFENVIKEAINDLESEGDEEDV